MLAAVGRQRLQALAFNNWCTKWRTNSHGAHLRRILAAPTKRVLDLHTGLRRAASSAIIQLQTGKIGLASYLGTFATESIQCPCDTGVQDVSHVLTKCPQYQNQRKNTI